MYIIEVYTGCGACIGWIKNYNTSKRTICISSNIATAMPFNEDEAKECLIYCQSINDSLKYKAVKEP